MTRSITWIVAAAVAVGGAAAYYAWGTTGQQAGVVIMGPGGAVGAPEPGRWRFQFGADGEQGFVDCVGPGLPPSRPGPAMLTTSNHGQIVRVVIDGQSLTYYRMSGPNGVYRTDHRSFAVRRRNDTQGQGTVRFEIRTTTPRAIVGALNWNNNQDCSGRYPFTMTWESELATITTIRPMAGRWRLELGPPQGNCEPLMTHFADVPDVLTLSHLTDPATGEMNDDIRIDGLIDSAGFLDHTVIYRFGNTTNWTGDFEEFDLGIPMDGTMAMFDYVDTPFTGWFDFEALDNTQMTGRMVAFSSACTAVVPATLTFIPES